MSFPLVVQRNTTINARPDQRMATGRVVQAFVRQPINLSPGGNTVAMTVKSENPFEGGRRITVVTQASGGMAKPDRQMQSKRLQGQSGLGGWTTRPHRGGFRGLDGLGALPRSSMSRASAMGIVNGDQSRYDQTLIDEANAINEGAMLAADDAAEAPAAPDKPFDWAKAGDIFTSTVKTGADIYSQVKGKPAPGMVTQYLPSRAAPAKSNTVLYIALGGAAALGLLIFLLRKKGGAATAA